MPKLLRPYIPLKIRCRVALRQLGREPDYLVSKHHGQFGSMLAELSKHLGQALGCEPSDLRLDHDPALGARQKVFVDGVHVGYIPNSNDAEHLVYREESAHKIKTNVRGIGAQRPDRVLIKRQRWVERGKPKKRSRPIPNRPFQKGKRPFPKRKR